LKKIEASLIKKRLLRISSQTFVSSVLDLSLSHALGNIEFSWSTLRGVWHTWIFGSGKAKEAKRK